MKTQQDKDYINFLKNINRLRNSSSYIEAEKLTSYDILGTAAMFELRRLDRED